MNKKRTLFGPIDKIIVEQEKIRNEIAAREKRVSATFPFGLAKNGQSSVFLSPLNFAYFFSLYTIIAREIRLRKKTSRKQMMVLEIGCGTGWGSFYLAKIFPGVKFCATNIDKKSIDYASVAYKRDNLKFLYLDGLKQKKFRRQFDLVFSIDVIEHLNQKKQLLFLEESIASLKKGGAVIFSTPLRESLWGLPALGWAVHAKEYSSASEVENFLKKASLRYKQK